MSWLDPVVQTQPSSHSYRAVFFISETWELARRRSDFDEFVGTTMLQKMFEMEPETKKVFGFDIDFNPSAEELKKSGKLHIATNILHRFDASLNLMGPDYETLDEILRGAEVVLTFRSSSK